METTVNTTSGGQGALLVQPRFSGMSHVSLPCRDLEESKIFYGDVMGGKLIHEVEGFVEFRIEDIIIGLSEQPEGWTGPEDEYPHYAAHVRMVATEGR
jgi:catechol 2,3-dioxygenase-like lactoylglutathione lyase family enzyme